MKDGTPDEVTEAPATLVESVGLPAMLNTSEGLPATLVESVDEEPQAALTTTALTATLITAGVGELTLEEVVTTEVADELEGLEAEEVVEMLEVADTTEGGGNPR